MFNSIYSNQLMQYYNLRCSVLSESARKHELCYLRRFDSYVAKSISCSGKITEDFINGWISSLSGKSSTIGLEVITIRQFLQFLVQSGENVFLPIVPKVREDYMPYIFSDYELECIFKSADNVILKDKKADPYLAIEFPVIVRLLYSCGLRIGETVRLLISDIDLDKGILRLVNTKGNKQRLVPMSYSMTDILSKYCLAMGLSTSNGTWLFPSSRDIGPISHRSVKHKFEKVLKENNIHLDNRKKYERGPCLHCFRHVFAFKSFAQLEQQGRPLDDAIPYLSIYLGHEGLDETSKYLKFSNELFPESIVAFGSFMDGLLPEVDRET